MESDTFFGISYRKERLFSLQRIFIGTNDYFFSLGCSFCLNGHIIYYLKMLV